MGASELRRIYEKLALQPIAIHRVGWQDWLQQSTYFAALVQIGVRNDSSVLDVGCGQGDLYAFLGAGGFSGLPTGSDLAVNAESGNQYQPAVAYGGGVYLVVWTTGASVRGQLVQPSGALTGTAFDIGLWDENTSPAVDYNPVSGEFLVAWANHNSTDGNNIRARRVSTAGTLLGSQVQVAVSWNDLMPAVAHAADGHYMLAFLYDEYPDQFAPAVQRLSSAGELLGGPVKVYSAPTNSIAPDLAYNPQADEYLVVWRESTLGSTEDVYARRVRSDGAVLGRAVSLGAQIGDPYYPPSAAYHPGANNFLVVWADSRNENWDAYGRLVDADGTPMGSAFALEATSANQTDVTVARQGYAQDLVLAYSDDRNGNSDVYGERYIPPMASFAAAPQIGAAPLTVVFTDTSTAPNGITAWEWDFGGSVTSTLQNPTHTYTLFGSYWVSLTAQSGLEADRQRAQVTVLNTPPPTTTVISYAYDGLYRLKRATYPTGELFEYAYDAVGNRTAYTRTLSSQVVTTYTYDAANRLTSVNGRAYTFDANGNLLSDGEKSYIYDQANRLLGITADGLSWSAAYNGDGARLRQVANGVATTYTLDLNTGLVQVLVQQDATGATCYLHGVGVTRIGEQQPGGWAYHGDAVITGGALRGDADDLDGQDVVGHQADDTVGRGGRWRGQRRGDGRRANSQAGGGRLVGCLCSQPSARLAPRQCVLQNTPVPTPAATITATLTSTLWMPKADRGQVQVL